MRIPLGTKDRISGIALLLFALIFTWESCGFPMGTLKNPGAALMPMLLALFLGGIALLLIGLGGNSPPLRRLDWAETRKLTAILAACGCGALALEGLGYRITMALVLAFFLGVVERNRLIVVIAVALGFSLISYWVFTRLGIILPRGPLSI
jgi:hypothetical protein